MIVCISLIVFVESRVKVDVDFRGVSKMATNIFRLALYTIEYSRTSGKKQDSLTFDKGHELVRFDSVGLKTDLEG